MYAYSQSENLPTVLSAKFCVRLCFHYSRKFLANRHKIRAFALFSDVSSGGTKNKKKDNRVVVTFSLALFAVLAPFVATGRATGTHKCSFLQTKFLLVKIFNSLDIT
jgi:hypothetical protein